MAFVLSGFADEILGIDALVLAHENEKEIYGDRRNDALTATGEVVPAGPALTDSGSLAAR
jgi:hypothetical protein